MIVFKEIQKFTQWWLWFILIGITMIPVFGIYKQIFLGETFGDKPMSDIGLILFLGFMLLFLFLFWTLKMITIIDENSISIKFFPLANKKIEWREVQTAEIVNYGFVGGWGVRLGTKYGTVYNTAGNKGLALILNNGKKICIGTQQEEELKKVVGEIRNRIA